MKAVVLLSGGLDSSTTLYLAKKQGYSCNCLIFNYGQRHKRELVSATKIAKLAKSKYKIIRINLPWGGSSLLKSKNLLTSKIINLPHTYVPGRNTIFISFALSYAETIGAKTIFIGANAVDFSGYPDCRPKYYKAWEKLIRSLDLNIKIKTPLIKMSKADIILLGLKLRVPYHLTWSCYKGGKKPCGVCDSCKFRAKGFDKLSYSDPIK